MEPCVFGGGPVINNGYCIFVNQLVNQGFDVELPKKHHAKLAGLIDFHRKPPGPLDKFNLFVQLQRDLGEVDSYKANYYQFMADQVEKVLEEMGCPNPRLRSFTYRKKGLLLYDKVVVPAACVYNDRWHIQ